MRINFQSAKDTIAKAEQIFRFDVQLLSGPITEEFVAKNPDPPVRTIEILSSQTLEMLHYAIFQAFDRYDAHMYTFQVGSMRPYDRKGARYGIPYDFGDGDDEKDARITTIGSLSLKVTQKMLYIFDFGDDWMHAVTLTDILPMPALTAKELKKNPFPRLTASYGESPPQYPDYDEDYDEDYDDDDDFDDDDGFHELDGTILKIIAPEAPPSDIKRRYEAIFAILQDFCKKSLTDDYIAPCETLLKVAFQAHIPLDRSQAKSWAGGVLCVIADMNFFDDPSLPSPNISEGEIAKALGVAVSTMRSKAKELDDKLPLFHIGGHLIPDEVGDAVSAQVNEMFADEKINEFTDERLKQDGIPDHLLEAVRNALIRMKEIDPNDTHAHAALVQTFQDIMGSLSETQSNRRTFQGAQAKKGKKRK